MSQATGSHHGLGICVVLQVWQTASGFNPSEGISAFCAEWSLWVNPSALPLGFNSYPTAGKSGWSSFFPKALGTLPQLTPVLMMWPYSHILGKEWHSDSHWESQSMEGLWWDILSPKLAWPSFQGSQFESSMSLYSSKNRLVSKHPPWTSLSISGSHALVQLTFKATAQYGQHSSRDYKAHIDSQICSGWVTHSHEHTCACQSGQVKAVYFRKTCLPLVSTLSQNQHGLDLTHRMTDRQIDRHWEGDLVMW